MAPLMWGLIVANVCANFSVRRTLTIVPKLVSFGLSFARCLPVVENDCHASANIGRAWSSIEETFGHIGLCLGIVRLPNVGQIRANHGHNSSGVCQNSARRTWAIGCGSRGRPRSSRCVMLALLEMPVRWQRDQHESCRTAFRENSRCLGVALGSTGGMHAMRLHLPKEVEKLLHRWKSTLVSSKAPLGEMVHQLHQTMIPSFMWGSELWVSSSWARLSRPSLVGARASVSRELRQCAGHWRGPRWWRTLQALQADGPTDVAHPHKNWPR